MVISTGSHPALLWPGVAHLFGQSYNAHEKQYIHLFDVLQSDQHYEKDVELTSMGLAPVKDEGKSSTYRDITQGYSYNYTHIAYSLGYIVTKEELKDNLYMKASTGRVKALAWAMNQTRETVGANIYNRSSNAAYTFGDGQPILSTAHPSQAGTWKNELTSPADLSEAALEDILILIMKAKDSTGMKINLNGKCLVVPPDLAFEAERIMKTNLRVESANNDLNAIKNMGLLPGGVKINQYLTDEDAWFIRTDCPVGLTHYERDMEEFEKDNDFDTGNAKAKKYERYSFGCTDPRSLYGSVGA